MPRPPAWSGCRPAAGPCGSSMLGHDRSRPCPTSPRFLTQDDRITIADALQAKLPVKGITGLAGKSGQTVYWEIQRGSNPDGRYQPWWGHNRALLRRLRPRKHKIRRSEPLRALVREKPSEKW